ncbi:MAG: NADH/NAD ratio-sensing transcriptional regulator Rex, partial [Arcticibacterium sp.]
MIAVFKCLLVLLISILSILNLQAQSVSSILVDANTKAPIAYASVVLKNKQGVISNEEGSFTLQLEGLIKATDSLFISCMGYEN